MCQIKQSIVIITQHLKGEILISSTLLDHTKLNRDSVSIKFEQELGNLRAEKKSNFRKISYSLGKNLKPDLSSFKCKRALIL